MLARVELNKILLSVVYQDYLIFLFALPCLVILLSVCRVLALTVLHLIQSYNQMGVRGGSRSCAGCAPQKLGRSVGFN